MQAAPPSSSRPAGESAPEATELVTRPDPGLARGKWEASPWMFWAMLGAILVGALTYTLRRMGFLSRAKPKQDSNTPPPSRGNKR
jgi:hypothetical protein